jgi:hypothetical protein
VVTTAVAKSHDRNRCFARLKGSNSFPSTSMSIDNDLDEHLDAAPAAEPTSYVPEAGAIHPSPDDWDDMLRAEQVAKVEAALPPGAIAHHPEIVVREGGEMAGVADDDWHDPSKEPINEPPTIMTSDPPHANTDPLERVQE